MSTAIVTGASSGIGAATAIALGVRGWNVAIGARRVDRLAETAAAVEAAGGKAFAHPLDVCDEDSIETFFEAAEDAFGVAGALVANAGMSTPGAIHTVSPDAIRTEIETNLLGVILTARRAVDALLAEKAEGSVVFLSSDAVREARPRMSTYAATKAGVELFARSLAMELEGSGIRSMIVRIGPTITEFGAGWDMDEIVKLMPYWQSFGMQRHDGYLSAEQVADAIVTAVSAPRGVHLDVIEIRPEAPRSRE
ncbi:MAG: SDR family NAD(P)-dependent oxidoreductase [Acidimicrobiia bacterium]